MQKNRENGQKSVDFSAYIEGFQRAHIVVIGDLMLDRFIYGRVDRISPEGPVPVLSIERTHEMLGGAGNALANLAGLGAHAQMIGLIGDDSEGRAIETLIEALGYSAKGLVRTSARPTIVKTRYLAGHQQLLRSDYERLNILDAQTEDDIIDQAKAALEQALSKGRAALIISDYGKAVLTERILTSCIAAAKALDIPVFVDPKGADFTKYRGANAITPNKAELSRATKAEILDNDAQIEAAALYLMKTCEIETIFATRSREGISVIRQDRATHIHGADIEVFDVSGAGDSVIATIAASVAAGASYEDAARLANLAGQIVVSKVGTAPIRRAELLKAAQAMRADAAQPSLDRMRQAPLLNWDDAKEAVQRWRARGLKVGFTNGCFDVLHEGHAAYLNEARVQCDRLVVALNHDESVKILKGADRPVHDEASRAAVLGALASVDLVVLFGAHEGTGDNTAIELIEMLQPDLYFKGGDYTLDQIPEAPSVQAYGGQVKVMSMQKGHSSTNSIEKMNDQAA